MSSAPNNGLCAEHVRPVTILRARHGLPEGIDLLSTEPWEAPRDGCNSAGTY